MAAVRRTCATRLPPADMIADALLSTLVEMLVADL
jgi:hypothetical protein